MESGSMAKKKEMENTWTLNSTCIMMASGKTISGMGGGTTNMKEIYFKGTLRIMLNLGLEWNYLKMVIVTLETMPMENLKDKENIFGLIVPII